MARRPWLLLLVVVVAVPLGACRKSPAPATAEPNDASTVVSITPAPTLSVPPSPSASASASAAANVIVEPPIFPTPATPPGADPLHVEIASAICKAAKMKTVIGCRSHPPFVKKEQMPDGTLPEFNDPDSMTFCGIDKVYKGSFTAAGKSQVVVSFSSCKEDENATWGAGNPGSGVVVEKTDGAHWRVVAYEADINLEGCKIAHLKKADRDTLFCRNGFSAGAGSLTYFTHLDFARSDAASTTPKKARTVAYIFSDEVHCGMMNPMSEPEFHVPGFAIADAGRDFALTDVNADGTPDLVLTVQRASLPASPTLDNRIKTICNTPGGSTLPNKQDVMLIPKSAMKPTKIEIVSGADETFAPTPASKKLLEEWASVANSGATQLRGVTPPPLDPSAPPF